MEKETQQYPIDSRCKDCSLYQVVEELKKEIVVLKAKVTSLEKELEEYRKPPKDSNNSSIPSSQNRWNKKYPKRKNSNLKTGGQQGHIGTNKAYSEEVDEVVNLDASVCPYCGGTHFIENDKKSKRKQLIDIDITPKTTEYIQHHLICSNCKRKVPNIPFATKGNVEYGAFLNSIVGYMNIQCNMSYSRIVKFFKEICKINLSEGTIDNIINKLAEYQSVNTNTILVNLKKSKVIGSDETSIRVNKKNRYLWVLQNEQYSYFANGDRSFDTLTNIIGTDYDGYWVSDRYHAQLKVGCKHQLCLSHIIRECRYLIESDNSVFANNLKNILEKSIHFRNEYGTSYEPTNQDIFRKIQTFEKELNILFKKKPKEKSSLKLWKSLVCRQKELLLFLRDKEIPPTNNASERALRNLGFQTLVIQRG